MDSRLTTVIPANAGIHLALVFETQYGFPLARECQLKEELA